MQLIYNLAAILVVILIIPVFMIRSIRERGFVEESSRVSVSSRRAHLSPWRKKIAYGYTRRQSAKSWRQVR